MGLVILAIAVIVLVVGSFGLLLMTGGLRMRDGSIIGRQRKVSKPKMRSRPK